VLAYLPPVGVALAGWDLLLLRAFLPSIWGLVVAENLWLYVLVNVIHVEVLEDVVVRDRLWEE